MTQEPQASVQGSQPVVTIYDEELDKYIIVDGFHRYTVMRKYADIRDTTNGYLPVVVIDKPIAERAAKIIARHTRRNAEIKE